MSIVDQDKILHGTVTKNFVSAYNDMANDYNESTAHEFFYTYCDTPLSFIMDNSRKIFSETYFGYDFYRDIITNHVYDVRIFDREVAKLRAYLDLAYSKHLPANQIDMYTNILEQLICSNSAYQNTARIMTLGASCDGGEEFIKEITDMIYYANKETERIVEMYPSKEEFLDIIAEAIFSVKSIYCKIPLGFIFCMSYPNYFPFLVEATNLPLADKTNSPKALQDITRLQNCITLMMYDQGIVEILKEKNKDLLLRWNEISKKNIAEARCKEKQEKVIENLNLPNPNTIDDSITMVQQYSDFIKDEDYKDQLLCEKYDNLQRRKAIYEASLEMMPDYEGLVLSNAKIECATYEAVSDLIDGIEAELLYMEYTAGIDHDGSVIYEWEATGEPNSVLRDHILSTREREAGTEGIERRTLISNLETRNNAKSSLNDLENELAEEITEYIDKLRKYDKDKSELSDTERKKLKELLKESTEKAKEFKKEVSENSYTSTAKDALSKLNGFIEDLTLICESCSSVQARAFLSFMEDGIGGEEDKKETPKKPKTDMATKIQNKALDNAAKNEEKLAKFDEKRQKLKNAANAVSETPKRISSDFSSFIHNFDKWDDNRRKKFLLKPGYRHKIFKMFRRALTYGAVAQVKLAWVPLVACINHLSKEKDKRIRTELSRELDNEIKIVEEKINDAKDDPSDRKTKYELMRIRDKLVSEKQRVRLNSKYV